MLNFGDLRDASSWLAFDIIGGQPWHHCVDDVRVESVFRVCSMYDGLGSSHSTTTIYHNIFLVFRYFIHGFGKQRLGSELYVGHRDFFSCPLYFFPYINLSLFTFFFLCFFVVFHSCCSHSQVYGKTLVHEFPISSSHTEWNFLLSLNEIILAMMTIIFFSILNSLMIFCPDMSDILMIL